MQKLLQLALLMIFFSILTNFLHANSEIKAVQISYIDAQNFKELENKFLEIKRKGFNTIIFRVFQNNGDRFYPFIKMKNSKFGIYYKSKFAPCVNDCLKNVIKICKKLNLKIIAWMETRNCDFGLKGVLYRKIFKYNFKTKKFTPSKGLSFFVPENIFKIKKLFQDLAKYNIDGILIQDDVKILVDEDFNPFARKIFFKLTGKLINENYAQKKLFCNIKSKSEITSDFLNTDWQKFKIIKLKAFLEELITSIKKVKKIKIFANVNYETLDRSELSRLWYSYDLNSLFNTGVDVFSVMLYQEQMKNELSLKNGEILSFIKKILINSQKYKNLKFLFKIQSYDWYSKKFLDSKSIFNLLTFLKNNNIKNVAIFPYNKKLFEKSKNEIAWKN